MKRKGKSLPVHAFEFHGVDFSISGQDVDNWCGTCPFCWKEDHFYVEAKTGQFNCKHCGLTGNKITFLNEIADRMAKETHAKDFDRIAKDRGLPPEAFRVWGIGYDGVRWLLPCRSDSGSVRDIRVWPWKGKLYNTDSCDSQLFGMHQLAASRPGATVWICEGEWDAIALKWLLSMAGREDVVVAVPGADTFKEEWAPFFRGMKVILCYDNDEAGVKGALRAWKMLKGRCGSLKYLWWPASRPEGWDIRDYVVDGRGKDISAQYAVRVLEALLRPDPKNLTPEPKEMPAALSGQKVTPEELGPIAFQEVLDVFTKWVKVDDEFEWALAIALAVCLSNSIPGDPLWFYLVAPPASGKTVILMSLQDAETCVFRSTLTPASLVSGFDRKPDPSLLPLLNGKTAVFKDGTELLAMHPDARREAYSILRGAFDGRVSKSYGNGVERDYPNLHFNVLIGVTPAIHGDEQAAMGERFLRYEMREDLTGAEEKIMKAVTNIAKEAAMEQELSTACRRFLARKVEADDLPTVPARYVDRLVALSQLLSILRAQVEREGFGERDLKYRPFYEAGTRVAKQLAKLGQMLTFVYGVSQVNEAVYRIVSRVAVDSTVGYHFDLVKAIVESEKGLTRTEAARRARMPSTSAYRRIQDLEQLGAVYKYQDPNTPRGEPIWRVSDRVTGLWNRSMKLNGVHQPLKPGGVRIALGNSLKTGLTPVKTRIAVQTPSKGRGPTHPPGKA